MHKRIRHELLWPLAVVAGVLWTGVLYLVAVSLGGLVAPKVGQTLEALNPEYFMVAAAIPILIFVGLFYANGSFLVRTVQIDAWTLADSDAIPESKGPVAPKLSLELHEGDRIRIGDLYLFNNSLVFYCIADLSLMALPQLALLPLAFVIPLLGGLLQTAVKPRSAMLAHIRRYLKGFSLQQSTQLHPLSSVFGRENIHEFWEGLSGPVLRTDSGMYALGGMQPGTRETLAQWCKERGIPVHGVQGVPKD
jgi:hypothetical protein